MLIDTKFSRRIFTSLVCIFLIFFELLPQGLSSTDIWPEDPHASKLRRVTMAPPALSTGAVTFSVPLYEIRVEDLSLPLELKYYSNGIKVYEDPYPVGYGWSLLPAFRITCQVLGRPDGYGFTFIGEKSPSDLKHSEMQRCMVTYGHLASP